MLFWVLTVLVVAIFTWRTVDIIRSDFFQTLLGQIMAVIGELVLGAIVWFVLVLGLSVGLAHSSSTNVSAGSYDTNLRAIATKDVTEGRFSGSIFGSYGYIDGKRVISYITQNSDGGIRVGYIDAENVTIYEGDDTPHIRTNTWTRTNLWFFPGTIDSANSYDLFVPEGSVVDGYEVAP